MRILIRVLTTLLLLGIAGLATALWLALSDAALVDLNAPLSQQDIARAKQVLERNRPHLSASPIALQTAEFAESDLNLVGNYLMQRFVPGSVDMRITADRLHTRATLRLPQLRSRNLLNIDARLRARDGRLVFTALKIGRLDLPARLANLVSRRLIAYLGGRHLAELAELPIRAVELDRQHLRVHYALRERTRDQARGMLLTAGDRTAMRFYHDRIVELQTSGALRTRSVSRLMQTLFNDAQQRSQTADPVIENISLLTVLGTWAARQDLARLVPDAGPRPRAFHLKLQGRIDLGRHFLASAALAARGDEALSHAVGLFKEISDTEHGSGFSFTDIAADRAGTRFGELATRSPAHARRVQARVAAGIVDGDIIPPVHDLAENLKSAEFEARFGHIGSAAYQAVIDDIEQRIDRCRLYRD